MPDPEPRIAFPPNEATDNIHNCGHGPTERTISTGFTSSKNDLDIVLTCTLTQTEIDEREVETCRGDRLHYKARRTVPRRSATGRLVPLFTGRLQLTAGNNRTKIGRTGIKFVVISAFVCRANRWAAISLHRTFNDPLPGTTAQRQ